MVSRRGIIGGMYFWAIVAVVALIALAVIARNVRKILHPRVPRPPVSRIYSVEKVTSGAQIEVSAGRKGRHIATVILADIDASAWPEESRKHLEGLTGKTIRVETERRGLFRSTPDGEAQSSRQGGEANDEALSDDGDGDSTSVPERIVTCDECKGTGKTRVNETELMAQAKAAIWFNSHQYKCERCRKAKSDADCCDEAKAQLKACEEEAAGPAKWTEDQCWACGGTGQVVEVETEARGPILGYVYGESGALLQLSMLMDGYATCLPSADKTWKAEEAKAAKGNRGMWGAK